MSASTAEHPRPLSRFRLWAASTVASAYRCIGWRLIVALTVTLVTLLGTSGWLALRLHRQHLESLLEDNALTLGETIHSSTRALMLENDRERLGRVIDELGRHEEVATLRLIDGQGVVRFSSRAAEVGQIQFPDAPACTGCHIGSKPNYLASTGDTPFLYATASGKGSLGLAVPVFNAPECSEASCHIHPPQRHVLGILDVELSTNALESAMAASRRQFGGLAVITMVLSCVAVGLLAWRLVHEPTRELLRGTRRLSFGDLDHRVEIRNTNEFGEVAASFNEMASRIGRQRKELDDWNASLTRKVEEKTRALERAQSQAVFVEKMASLGKLAAVVAHEINNPLAGILVATKLVRRRLGKLSIAETSRLDDTLAMMERETARCGDIVRNLLLFSRKKETALEAADLGDVVQQAADIVRHQADLQAIEIGVTVGPRLPQVVCDAAQIGQGCVALLINAIEAMPDGGKVDIGIGVDSAGDNVRIVVADTGPGIPPEIQDRVFEPFFSTKEEGQGTGLGLSVLYGIVQLHGGTVTLDSTPGEGTRFSVLLPIAKTVDGTQPDLPVETLDVSGS